MRLCNTCLVLWRHAVAYSLTACWRQDQHVHGRACSMRVNKRAVQHVKESSTRRPRMLLKSSARTASQARSAAPCVMRLLPGEPWALPGMRACSSAARRCSRPALPALCATCARTTCAPQGSCLQHACSLRTCAVCLLHYLCPCSAPAGRWALRKPAAAPPGAAERCALCTASCEVFREKTEGCWQSMGNAPGKLCQQSSCIYSAWSKNRFKRHAIIAIKLRGPTHPSGKPLNGLRY